MGSAFSMIITASSEFFSAATLQQSSGLLLILQGSVTGAINEQLLNSASYGSPEVSITFVTDIELDAGRRVLQITVIPPSFRFY